MSEGPQINSDMLCLAVVLVGPRGAPLITHVLPHLVAQSGDPMASVGAVLQHCGSQRLS